VAGLRENSPLDHQGTDISVGGDPIDSHCHGDFEAKKKVGPYYPTARFSRMVHAGGREVTLVPSPLVL
jgi:hypothetical protein